MINRERAELFRNYPTPFYYYDTDLLRRTLSSLRQEASRYGYRVCYAIKANHNPGIVSIVREYGFGVDAVSANEIKCAVELGFEPQTILFAGVGKSDSDIAYALDAGIGCFNVESLTEIGVVDMIARERGVTAPVALRINPSVDALTHYYITTGVEESKFGILQRDLPGAVELLNASTNIEMRGLHFHVGSQVCDLSVYKSLSVRVNEINEWFYRQGYRLTDINVGGGLGIDYSNPDTIPPFADYFSVFARHLELHPYQQLSFEIGRAAVGQCGSLISKVLYVKDGIASKFLIIDAGMNDLIRPALYQACHKIENLTSARPERNYCVVGPVCESSDTFSLHMAIAEAERGDIVAIRSAGAYGESMASRYNLRGLPGAIFSSDLA